jgi:hypothetical protein
MSKASNPTRPDVTSAGALQQLDDLTRADRVNLEKWGYPVRELRRVAEVEDQADAVDALLAILLARPGYKYNDRDLKQATRVSKTLGAIVEPRVKLVQQGQVRVFNAKPMPIREPGAGRDWKGPLAGLGICFGVIVVIALLVLLFK